MIKLASPDIQEEDIKRVVEVLRSGNLVQGSFVKELEKRIIEYTDIPFCSVVSSGTAALHLSLMVLGIGQGDSVIVPAFTFPATSNVVEILGAEIVLCDVNINSYVIDPEKLEQLIIENRNKNIKALIIVHEFGYPAEIKKISAIANKYNLLLIEDAACAFGSVADGHSPGYYSDLACYSFHPRKAITTGEGGSIVSNNLDLITKINSLKNHGIGFSEGKSDFIHAGLNYRMSDFQAALAIGQFNRFNNELIRRKEIAATYLDLLGNNTKIDLPEIHEAHSWQTFMLKLRKDLKRSTIIDELLKMNIQTNLGAQAINCLTYYRDKYGFDETTAPVASSLYTNGLALPLYGKLSELEINSVAEALLTVIK